MYVKNRKEKTGGNMVLRGLLLILLIGSLIFLSFNLGKEIGRREVYVNGLRDLKFLLTTDSLELVADEVCKALGLEPFLFKGLIKVESNWNVFARGSKGEIGLCQIHPKYEEDILFNPFVNMLVCGLALARWKVIYGNLERAVEAYNAGYKRNPFYLKKVKGEAERLRNMDKFKRR